MYNHQHPPPAEAVQRCVVIAMAADAQRHQHALQPLPIYDELINITLPEIIDLTGPEVIDLTIPDVVDLTAY